MMSSLLTWASEHAVCSIVLLLTLLWTLCCVGVVFFIRKGAPLDPRDEEDLRWIREQKGEEE
jgi:hypothetical protein